MKNIIAIIVVVPPSGCNFIVQRVFYSYEQTESV